MKSKSLKWKNRRNAAFQEIPHNLTLSGGCTISGETQKPRNPIAFRWEKMLYEK